MKGFYARFYSDYLFGLKWAEQYFFSFIPALTERKKIKLKFISRKKIYVSQKNIFDTSWFVEQV